MLDLHVVGWVCFFAMCLSSPALAVATSAREVVEGDRLGPSSRMMAESELHARRVTSLRSVFGRGSVWVSSHSSALARIADVRVVLFATLPYPTSCMYVHTVK